MFWIVWVVLVLERVVELVIARRNYDRLIGSGAIEFGAAHYPWVVAMHATFFLAIVGEEVILRPPLPMLWPVWMTLLALAQALRFWTLGALGGRWTTRVVVSPGERLVSSGPYRFLRHPNYVVVAVELLSFPLLFGLYWTAAIFTVLNAAILLFVRLPVENAALRQFTSYLPSSQYARRATLSRSR